MGALSDERGESFHQDIFQNKRGTMEKGSLIMLAHYC
jgi:hypothetical protein